jgi:hypothetical protein
MSDLVVAGSRRLQVVVCVKGERVSLLEESGRRRSLNVLQTFDPRKSPCRSSFQTLFSTRAVLLSTYADLISGTERLLIVVARILVTAEPARHFFSSIAKVVA